MYYGGILPNANKGLSLITYPTAEAPSSHTSEPRTISVTRQPAFDFGTVEGKVVGPAGMPAIGASVIAEKRRSHNFCGEGRRLYC